MLGRAKRAFAQGRNELLREKAKGLRGVAAQDARMFCAEYSGVDCWTHIEESGLFGTEVTCLEGDEIDGFGKVVSYLEHVYLAIDNQNFKLANNHLIDDRGKILYEPGIDLAALPTAHNYFSRKVERLKGSVAYLSNGTASHYGHWLQFALPLHRLYKKHVSLEAIDYYYVGDVGVSEYMRHCLSALEISMG